jgi:hypothetical protein
MNRAERIAVLRNFPDRLTALVSDLADEQLTTHYLDGEWTVAQNVHHLADSHMNSFIRLKLILTEDDPKVKSYDQDLWADTAEANDPNLASSLSLLRGLHERWVVIFESLTDEQWGRTGQTTNTTITPEDLLRIYSNHCDAHVDQIERTLAAGKS